MFTLNAKLTTTTDSTYETVEEWIAEHGPCGVENFEFINSGEMTLNDDQSVLITLEYDSEDTYLSHKEAYAHREDNRKFIVEFIESTE